MSSNTQAAPAQPKSILRGHRSPVHITTFIRENQRLVSGDADGFVVIWDLTIMRPRAVWRAHTGAILGISGWGRDKLITQGKDTRLVVWKITESDEAALSTALPLDESAPERPQPWILHILEINTMNFCSFAHCPQTSDAELADCDELLVAVPNTLAAEAVDIFHLPSQERRATVSLGSKAENKGMVMALSLFWLHHSLYLIAGYENGLAVVARRGDGWTWDVLYRNQAHTQPILSLDIVPHKEYFLTSGADAIIAKHPIPNTKPTIPPTSFKGPDTPKTQSSENKAGKPNPSLLSAALAAERTANPGTRPHIVPKAEIMVETSPLKTLNTKHSGQQGLTIRSDGRIFATAGWDSKIRVYSAKTMAELAVLKWHEMGCYAVAFAALADNQKDASTESQENAAQAQGTPAGDSNAVRGKETSLTAVSRLGGLSVKDRRIQMAQSAHWLAAGSKDGKISLWDIY
ncbi:WD40 repeat-like protein [Xylaria sp. CBS 124048]|nr:WD40 repeat-like protein [Xylaria sp. CBS 124048]